MSGGPPDRAAMLRQAFDRSFTEPVRHDAATLVDFLAIRVGDQPWAIRLDEVAGLYAGRSITPVPSSAAGLVGIAGFRGTILPIYDLARLLGRAASAPLRWLVTAAGAPAGFAFEGFDRHVRVRADAVLRQPDGQGESILMEDRVRPVIRMGSILEMTAAQGGK